MHLLSWLILVSSFLLTLGKNDIVAEEGIIFVKNTRSATFKWTFGFNQNAIGALNVYKLKKDGTKDDNIALVFKYGTGEYIRNTRSRFYNQLVIQTPQNGLILTINNIATTDEGLYSCQVGFINGDPLSTNNTELVVVVAPRINKENPTLQKTEDEFASLLCKAEVGNPKPLYFQWFKTDKNNNFQPITSVVAADERYDLNITKVKRDSQGKYQCLVTNRGGEDRHSITLNVRYKPVVTNPPLNRTVFENTGTTEFNCFADGNAGDTKYIWYQGRATPSNDISSLLLTNTDLAKYVRIENNQKRLTFIKPPRKYGGWYYCAGENELGTGEAKGGLLNVTYVPGEIFIPTSDGVVNGDEGKNLTVQCTSDANPPALYTWQMQKRINNVDRLIPLVENDFTGVLNLYNLTTNDTGEYKCIAVNYPNIENRDERGRIEKNIQIKIRYGPRQTNLTVNSMNHTTLEIIENTGFDLKCVSHSEPPATFNIQRYPGNTALNNDLKVGSYSIKKMTRFDEGKYICIATNTIMGSQETKSINVIVAVTPLLMKPIPETTKTVQEKATVVIQCKAEGKPPPTIFWQKYGSNFTTTDAIKIIYTEGLTNQNTKITSVASELRFESISYLDAASYSCVTFNFAGKINHTIAVDVQYAPKITSRPNNFTVRQMNSETVKFICDAKANPNTYQWKWFFNDGVNGNRELAETSNVFIRQIADRQDNGIYTCVASNSIGTGENATAYLVVEYAPTITEKPKAQMIVDIGSTVTLTCRAEGVPKPDIIWTKDSDTSFEVRKEILTLTNMQVKNMGFYTCSAKNVVGGTPARSKIIVKHAPIITTTSPSDTLFGVEIGETANLMCILNSYPVATITWIEQETGNVITTANNNYNIKEEKGEFGASSTLSLQVQEKQMGSKFICKAKNNLGSDDQQFQILGKGKPEAPVKLFASDIIQPTIPVTVNITLEWEPGYSGGYPVEFYLLYKETNGRAFSKQFIGAAQGNKYVFANRKSKTTYLFSMQAKNKLGYSSEYQPHLSFRTKDPPPDVVKVDIKTQDDGTSVVISWQILRAPGVARRNRRDTNKWEHGVIRYRQVDLQENWNEEIIENIPMNGTYVVTGLDANEKYQFHFVLYDSNGNFGKPFNVGELYPGAGPTVEERTGLSKNDIIGIGVGIGAFLLIITIIILIIAIHRKKDKKSNYPTTYNNGRVQVDIPTSTMRSGGYSDVVRASYLNDEDPFAVDSSVLDDTEDKSPPPDYDDMHSNRPPDYPDRGYGGQHTTFRPEEPTPSYTSFGRIPKTSNRSADNGQRAAEISRGNRNQNGDAYVDDYDEPEVMDPLLRRSITDLDDTYNQTERNRRSNRLSRENIVSDDDNYSNHGLRSPPSDEGNLNNRVPGAFGDRAPKYKKSAPPKYGDDPPSEPPVSPPSGFHQSGRSSPPSSIASSKPYRSDNEYIDDAEENYVGYLV